MNRNADVKDTIYYFSLNHTIRQGAYDAVTSAGKLKQYGDFGLGSEEKLAAELVLLDGIAYGIPATGIAQRMTDQTGIAFAVVTSFAADTTIPVSAIGSIKALHKQLDAIIPKNQFTAIRIDGDFTALTYRSYEKQEKPYSPIKHAKEHFFERKNIQGTMVGFYTPASAAALNAPAYHFHFISADKSTGGHVVSCNIKEATIMIDFASDLHVQLPVGSER